MSEGAWAWLLGGRVFRLTKPEGGPATGLSRNSEAGVSPVPLRLPALLRQPQPWRTTRAPRPRLPGPGWGSYGSDKEDGGGRGRHLHPGWRAGPPEASRGITALTWSQLGFCAGIRCMCPPAHLEQCWLWGDGPIADGC